MVQLCEQLALVFLIAENTFIFFCCFYLFQFILYQFFFYCAPRNSFHKLTRFFFIWLFQSYTAPPRFVIKLDFRNRFVIEPSATCEYDYLEVKKPFFNSPFSQNFECRVSVRQRGKSVEIGHHRVVLDFHSTLQSNCLYS